MVQKKRYTSCALAMFLSVIMAFSVFGTSGIIPIVSAQQAEGISFAAETEFFNIVLSLTNGTAQALEGTFIVAAYDNSDRLTANYIKEFSVAASGKATVRFDDLEDAEGYYKAFCWDKNYVPLAEAATIGYFPFPLASAVVVKTTGAVDVMTVGTSSITVRPGTTVSQLLAQIKPRDGVKLDYSVTLNGTPVTSGVLKGWVADVSDGINLKYDEGHVLTITQPSTGMTESRRIEVYDQGKIDEMGEYWNDVKYREIDETVNKNIPTFKNVDYKITDEKYAHLVRKINEYYGTAHPQTSFTEVTFYGDAIKAAIEECSANGGGRVVIPADGAPGGIYHTGAVYIKSNVNLHIEEGAVLKFVRTKTNEYYPIVLTQYEGSDVYNFSPFIYAFNEKNIAITGKGIVHGNTPGTSLEWAQWKTIANQQTQADRLAGGFVSATSRYIGLNMAKAPLTHRVYTWDGQRAPAGTKINTINAKGETEWIDIPEEAYNADALYLEGNSRYGTSLGRSILRPNFIQPYLCENVLIEGITVNYSPMWLIHPKLCTNVLIRDFVADSHNQNNDGCNPDGCKNVVVERGRINTDDDCMALKSGKNEDGQRHNRPVENYIIRYNYNEAGNGGITLGSELGAGARYIFSTDNRYNSPQLNTVYRFKTNSKRGPNPIEKMYHKDSIVLRSGSQFLLAQTQYSAGGYDAGDYGGFRPVIDGFWAYNIQSNRSGLSDNLGINATTGFQIQAYARAPIANVHFKNCTLVGLGSSTAANFSNVSGFELDNVKISLRGASTNSNLQTYNTTPVKISDVTISGTVQGQGTVTIPLDQSKNFSEQALPFTTLTGLTISGKLADNAAGTAREKGSTVQVFINRATSATGSVTYSGNNFTVTGISLSGADAHAIAEDGIAPANIRFISIRASNDLSISGSTYSIAGGNQSVAVFKASVS